MGVQVNDNGDMQVVLGVKDEGSAVVENFAKNAETSLDKMARESADANKKFEDNFEKTFGPKAPAVNYLEDFGKAVGKTIGALGSLSIGVSMYGMHIGSALNETSERLGVTVEWLQKMQYAAGFFGKEDALPSWLRLMNRNLAQAVETGRGLTPMFEAIGLDAQKLRESGPEKAFEAIVTAIGKIPDPMERTRVAMAVFGRGADDVVKMAKAMREAATDADLFRMSGESAAASNAFFNQLYRLTEILKQVPKLIAEDVAPPFSEMARIFATFVKQSGAIEVVATSLGVLLRGLASILVVLGTAFGLVGKSIAGFAAAFGALMSGNFREAITIGKEMAQELGETVKKFAELQSQLLGLGGGEKGGMKKMGFSPGGTSVAQVGTWSDMLPGAEVKAANDEEKKQLSDHQIALITQRREYHFELQGMDEAAARARQQIATNAMKGELSAMAALLNSAVGLMQSKSRAMFEIGKGAAIAEATINTYQAVSNALAIKPFWVGLALASVAFAKGIANVQAIKATSFGGGSAASPVFNANPSTGLPALPESASNDSAFSNGPAVVQADLTRKPERSVTLVGDFFTAELIRDKIIPVMQQAFDDGVVLKIRTANA